MLDRGVFTGRCYLCGDPCGNGTYCHTHKWAAGTTEPPRTDRQTDQLIRMAEHAKNGGHTT